MSLHARQLLTSVMHTASPDPAWNTLTFPGEVHHALGTMIGMLAIDLVQDTLTMYKVGSPKMDPQVKDVALLNFISETLDRIDWTS